MQVDAFPCLEAPNTSTFEQRHADVSPVGIGSERIRIFFETLLVRPFDRWRLCRIEFNATSFCCHTEEHLEVAVIPEI